MSVLQITMTFAVASPVHSTGDRAAFRIDKPTVLDLHQERDPIVTASSLKGLLRATAESLLRSQQKTVCLGPGPGQLCPELISACVVCRHFGSPRFKSPLRFFDARFNGDVGRDVRMGVGLDRRRRLAKEDHLFAIEIVQARKLVAEVTGLYQEDGSAGEAIALLYISSKAVFALGGGRSRGLGHVTLVGFEATIDEIEQDHDSIMENAMEILG